MYAAELLQTAEGGLLLFKEGNIVLFNVIHDHGELMSEQGETRFVTPPI